MVFVAPMGDLFHENINGVQIGFIFQRMAAFGKHRYIVLTKRTERMRSLLSGMCSVRGKLYENVWLGVSVEDQATADERIPILLQTPAAVRFVSVEPLLGPLNVAGLFGNELYAMHNGIDWLIVGCESGPRRRPCDPAWVKSIIEQCDAAGVPVFIKQLDLYLPSGANKISHDPSEWPGWARRREWPTIV